MNLTPTDIYWILQADSFVKCCVLFAFVFGLITAIFIVNLHDTKTKRIGYAHIGLSALFTIIFFLAAVFIPSTKTLTAMYVIPPVLNSDILQKDIPECVKTLIESITENIKVMKENK